MTTVKLHTGPGVFEVLVNVCRNPQEALKQFVENAADAIEQAEKIRRTVENKLFQSPQAQKSFTVSIGVAHYPGDASTKGELIRAVLAALQTAKSKGKNRVEHFSLSV